MSDYYKIKTYCKLECLHLTCVCILCSLRHWVRYITYTIWPWGCRTEINTYPACTWSILSPRWIYFILATSLLKTFKTVNIYLLYMKQYSIILQVKNPSLCRISMYFQGVTFFNFYTQTILWSKFIFCISFTSTLHFIV